MTEDNQMINVSASRTKADAPFHSNFEKSLHLRSRTIYTDSGPFKETQRVVNHTLGLYQLGQQHKSGSYSYQWPPPTVKNPWETEFFPTMHKMHEDSLLMLKPPTYTSVDQVSDSEIAKCSSWSETFATRSAHSASFSFTSLEAVYNFLQKVIMFLHSFRLSGLPQARRYTPGWPSAVGQLHCLGSPTDVTWCRCHCNRTLYSSTYALETCSLRIAPRWPYPASPGSTQGHVTGRSWPFWSECP